MAKFDIKKIFLIAPAEHPAVVWAFFYFFTLLSSYFILRPLRDEMGVLNGAANMQWLFTGTFISMLLLVPVFGYLTNRFKMGKLLLMLYPFFSIHILLFYLAFKYEWAKAVMPALFFVWLSVFNLFAVSVFWSFLVDIFSLEQSKRLFGIIAAGGSLGAICGPIAATVMAEKFGVGSLFLTASGLLLLVTFMLNRLMRLRPGVMGVNTERFKNEKLIGASVFDGMKMVYKSRFLQRLVVFMILYTSVSTFLYFEQAHIVEQELVNAVERIRYFARVDLLTNIFAIGGQLVLTNHLIKKFGLAIALSAIPILVGIGFLVLSAKTYLLVIAALLVLHRAGNYVLMKPGREMLYTLTKRGEKYKAKNFIDTAVYRGGDALSGWVFAGLFAIGLNLSVIAILAVPLIVVWAYTGHRLGQRANGISQPQSFLKHFK